MWFLNLGGTQCKTGGNGAGTPAATQSTQSVLFDRSAGEYAAKASPTAAIGSSITTVLSVSMWVKTSETGGAAVYPFIGQYDNTGNQYKWWFGMFGSIGYQGGLRFVSSGNGVAANVYDQTTGTKVNDGAWHHVAATYNGSGNVVLYVDGSSVVTVAASDATLFNSTADFTVSKVVGGSGALYWNGTADEIGFYNAELNSTQISALYNGGTPPDQEALATDTNLVGYWYMGDGDSAPTLTDQKGANDLTMVNTPTIVTDAP